MSWVDKLFLCVFVIIAFGVLRGLQDPFFKEGIRNFFRSDMATSAFIIFMFFYMIALADCIRFESGSTLLDLCIGKLNRTERTFSAPFARFLAVPSVEVVNGVPSFITEPLQYVTQKMNFFVVMHAIQKSLIGVFFYIIYMFTRKWGSALATTGVLFGVSAFLLDAGSVVHVFGTGQVGEDILYHTLKSVRTAMVIGIVTPLIMAPIAVVLGLLAGYFGSFIDDIIQYVYTLVSAIPSILLIATFGLFLQQYIEFHADAFGSIFYRADMRLLGLCVILALTSWTSLCRLLRAETYKLKALEMVAAAKTLGVSWSKILYRHILPNVMPIFIISVALDFSALVLSEAVLSYIGIGVDPSTPSFGMLINSARMDLARDPVIWWNLCAAFSFMLVLVLCANIIADRLRDVLDPRMARAC